METTENIKVPILICISESSTGQVGLVNVVDLQSIASSVDLIAGFSLRELTGTKKENMSAHVRLLLQADEFSSYDSVYGEPGDILVDNISDRLIGGAEVVKTAPDYYFFQLQFTDSKDRKRWSENLMNNKKYEDAIIKTVKDQHLLDRESLYCFNAEKVADETMWGEADYSKFITTKLDDPDSDDYIDSKLMLRKVCLDLFTEAVDHAKVLKQQA